MMYVDEKTKERWFRDKHGRWIKELRDQGQLYGEILKNDQDEMSQILNPKEGDMWTDEDTGDVMAYDGTNWVDTEPVTLENMECAPSDSFLQLCEIEIDNNMIAEFVTEPNRFVLYSEGDELVTVNLDSGNIEYGEMYTPDEAANIFWETIGKVHPSKDIWAQNQEITSTEVLRELRGILAVEEGENILDVARQVVGDAGHKSYCNWHKWDHKFSWSGDDCTCDITTLPGGLPVGAIEDLDYFREKLARAIKWNWKTPAINKLEKQIELLEESATDCAIINCPYIPENLSIDADGNAVWRAVSKAEQVFDDAMKVID